MTMLLLLTKSAFSTDQVNCPILCMRTKRTAISPLALHFLCVNICLYLLLALHFYIHINNTKSEWREILLCAKLSCLFLSASHESTFVFCQDLETLIFWERSRHASSFFQTHGLLPDPEEFPVTSFSVILFSDFQKLFSVYIKFWMIHLCSVRLHLQ